MLTVASNHTPYRLPPTLQEVMHAERQAAEHAAEIAANPPPVPEATVGRGGQDTGENGDNRMRTMSKTWSAGSKRGELAQQTSRLSRCTSARSGVSDSSFVQGNQDSSGSIKEV